MTEEMRARLAMLQERVELAAENLAPDTELTFQAMFGGIGGKAQGRMFASLSDRGLALKLPKRNWKPCCKLKAQNRCNTSRMRPSASRMR